MAEAQNLLQLEVVHTPLQSGATSMQTVENLNLIPVWVNPDHLAVSARILLQGHNLRVIGVVDSGGLIGTVSIERVLGVADRVSIKTIMEPLQLVLDSTVPIRAAADRFVQEDVDFAPVTRDGQFLGIVFANMLLREVGRSWDPRTGLAWSDQLREWGIEHLKNGNEVTILFIDLDQFGAYNKRFGYQVGDRVLKRVVDLLQQHVDPGQDMLVRYGGDEFAIGTVRSRADAELLASTLRSEVRELTVPDAGQVSFSVGVFGGKRTQERENTHYAATVDNLINLASRDCLANKPAPEIPEVAAPRAEGPAVQIVSVFVDESTANALTQVILRVFGQVVSGVSARSDRPMIQSVAAATAKALERAFVGSSLTVSDINLTETTDGQRLVSVTAQFTQGDQATVVGGIGSVASDVYGSVAEATIQAFLSASPSR